MDRGQDGAVRLERELRADPRRDAAGRRGSRRLREGPDQGRAQRRPRRRAAPRAGAPDGEQPPEEGRRLYQHYGRSDYDEWGGDAAGTGAGTTDTVGRDTS